jgi:hypothetical protein
MKCVVRLMHVGASSADDLFIIYGDGNKTTGYNLCQLFCEISVMWIINMAQ